MNNLARNASKTQESTLFIRDFSAFIAKCSTSSKALALCVAAFFLMRTLAGGAGLRHCGLRRRLCLTGRESACGRRVGVARTRRPGTMPVRRPARYQSRLGHMQPASRLNSHACAGEVVPAPQLRQRDSKAVGDGNQRIAAPGGVVHHARRRRQYWRHGHNQSPDALQTRRFSELVCLAISAGCTRYSFATEATVSPATTVW